MKGDGRGGRRPGAGRPGKDTVAVSFRLPRDIYNELIMLSETKGVSRTEVVQAAIEQLADRLRAENDNI